MNADSQQQRFFVALLFAAGYASVGRLRLMRGKEFLHDRC
jgi:hypothetical protein